MQPLTRPQAVPFNAVTPSASEAVHLQNRHITHRYSTEELKFIPCYRWAWFVAFACVHGEKGDQWPRATI